MRRLVLAVPALAAAVLFTGAACSSNSTPSAGSVSTSPAASQTTEPSGGQAAGGTPASGKATTAKTAACRTADLRATAIAQPERTHGTTRMAMIALVNKSSHNCALDGWAAISLVNAADEVVPVHTTQVNQPGTPTKTTLKPGTTAWEGIKWTVCDKGDATCGAGNTLRFNVQASTDGDVAELQGFPAPEASDITMKSLQIGSIQPSTQGVVAW